MEPIVLSGRIISMELRHLRYFQVLAEELHFGRAAARLHISQPPLTSHIKDLEREVGARLFDRTTRRVDLTEEGRLFLDRVGAVLTSLDDAVEEVRDHAAGRRGRIRVGFVSSASGTVIPPALRRFRDLNPHVRVDLSPLTTREQIDALQAGRLDLGLIRAGGRVEDLRVEPLVEESLVVVLPTHHRLADRTEVDIRDLIGERLILFPQTLMPAYLAQIWGLFAEYGAEPRVVQEAIHHETVLGLVSAEVGLSILPESVSWFGTDRIAIRPLAQKVTTALMIARTTESANPAEAAFVDCLYAAMGELPAV